MSLPRHFFFPEHHSQGWDTSSLFFSKKNAAMSNTNTGAMHDPKTGEVLDNEPPRRRRRVLTDVERDDRERVLAERAELRRAEVAALRALDPACETDGDPPVAWRVPKRMGGQPGGVLLDVPRVSGRGLPGSRLVIAARSYDGAGPNGGEAHEHATCFVAFRDGAGYLRRTVGLAIRREEGRAAVAALTRWLNGLDARDASDELTR